MEIHIGIDGGGTHAMAAAVTGDGSVLTVREGGSLNENNLGRALVREHLHALVGEVLRECGAERFTSLTAGLASLDGPGSPDMTAALCAPDWDMAGVRLESDAMVALSGGTLGAPGMAVICGTGSMILLADGQGRQRVSGGWGYALGDPGSGYELAAQAVRHVLCLSERGESTGQLGETVLGYFGVHRPRELLGAFYRVPFDPAFPAGLAGQVLSLAGEGEKVCLGMVREQMRRLADQAAPLLKDQDPLPDIYVYGGIFRHHPWTVQLFAQALEKAGKPEVAFPEFPPEIGAVLLGTHRGQDPAFVRELRASMKKGGWEHA